MISSFSYIPLDFIKVQIIGMDIDHFLKNPRFNFTPSLKEVCVINHHWMESDNIKIKVYESGWIALSGSIHKYFNGGKHNHNDFSQVDFEQALIRLRKEFGISPDNMRILCLEFGVNFQPPIETDRILNQLFQHKRKDIVTKISNKRGTYLVADHDVLDLKAYNKGKQFRLNYEVMRVEIKQKNWSEYRKLRIHTLQDFIEYDKTCFIEALLQRWDEVVFFDPTNKVVDKWMKYNNMNFWRELTEKSNTTYSKHFKRLKELNQTFGSHIQDEVKLRMLQKIENLQGFTNSTFSKTALKKLESLKSSHNCNGFTNSNFNYTWNS